jgi:chromosome segregation ATPase
LSDRLQRVEKDLITLSDKNDLEKIERLETEERDSEIILLKKRLKDSQKSLELIEADWQQLKNRNTKLQEGSKEQAEQYKALADRYTSAKDKLKNQDLEFSALNEKLQRNQINVKELAESKTLNKSLSDRLKRVEKDLISLTEKNNSSTSMLLQLKKRDSEIILLKKKLEDSQESLELVEADWRELKNRNTKLQEGSKEQIDQYRALSIRYTSAKDKLKNQELELAALNEELQRGLIIVKELADSKSLNKSLSDRLERVEKDLVSIGGEGGQLSNARLAIEARDSEIVILKKNLKKAQESLELVKLNSAKFEDRYESLKDGYQDQSVQLKNLTDRYTNSQNELKVQESELTALRKKLQKSQIIEKDFADSKRLNKSLSARLEIVEKDLISIRSDYKSLQSKWSKTSRSVTKINGSKSSLIAETLEMIQSLNESIERPFLRMDRINKDMELLKSTNLDVSKVEDLLSEIKFLQSDLEFSKTAIDLFYDFLQEDSTL